MDYSTQLVQRFGDAVRARRNELGVSQEELAERAGLHRTYVSDIERGIRNPSLKVIDRVAQALETSIHTLFSPALDSAAPHARPPHARPTESADILLVEDNLLDVKLTLRAFERARLKNCVHVVGDGTEALEYLSTPGTQLPSLILLDLKLPVMDGIELLTYLKNDKRTSNIPVVILTVSDNDDDIAACTRLGAEAYMVKPVDFQRIIQVTPQLHLSWMLLRKQNSGS